MNNRDENKISMFQTADAVLDKNSEAANALPKVGQYRREFKTSLGTISNIADKLQLDEKGQTINKEEKRKALISVILENSTNITAYAVAEENTLLLNEVKLFESKMKRMPDTELVNLGNAIYKKVQENIGALKDYFIDGQTQSDFFKAINDYKNTTSMPRLTISEKKNLNKGLAEEIKTAQKILDKITAQVNMLEKKNPDFHSVYTSAIKVINTGGKAKFVSGKITDAATGKPVAGASIKFEQSTEMMKAGGNGAAAINKKSAEKGGFKIKSPGAGTYTVTVSKPGYRDVVTTAVVTDDGAGGIVIILDKA